MASRYAELWELIKKDALTTKPEGVSIAASPRLHARIIKAVRKRKGGDIGFAFELADTRRTKAELVATPDGNTVKFSLRFITQLTAEDV